MTESKYLNTEDLDDALDTALRGVATNATAIANLQARVTVLESQPPAPDPDPEPPTDPTDPPEPPPDADQEDIDWQVLREKGSNWILASPAREDYDEPDSYLRDRIRQTIRAYNGKASGVIFRVPLVGAAAAHGVWKESTLRAMREALEELREIQPDLRGGCFPMLQTFNHPNNSNYKNFLAEFIWSNKIYGIGTHGDREPYGCSEHRSGNGKWYVHKANENIINCYGGLMHSLAANEDWCEILVTSESAGGYSAKDLPGYSVDQLVDGNLDMHLSLVPTLRAKRKILISQWNWFPMAQSEEAMTHHVHARLAPTRYVTLPGWPDLMVPAEGAGNNGELSMNRWHTEAARRYQTVLAPAIQSPTWQGNYDVLPQLREHAGNIPLALYWGNVGWSDNAKNNAHEDRWAQIMLDDPLTPERW